MSRTYYVAEMSYQRPEPHYRLVLQNDLVTLQQRGKDSFLVRYGKEVTTNLTYVEACFELGRAMMHQAACDSLLFA